MGIEPEWADVRDGAYRLNASFVTQIISCGVCGCTMWMPVKMFDFALVNKRPWWCFNGHENIFPWQDTQTRAESFKQRMIELIHEADEKDRELERLRKQVERTKRKGKKNAAP